MASNKLVELPSELSELPNLTSIDVAHNRLISFDSLGLQSMTSLRALNAQVFSYCLSYVYLLSNATKNIRQDLSEHARISRAAREHVVLN